MMPRGRVRWPARPPPGAALAALCLLAASGNVPAAGFSYRADLLETGEYFDAAAPQPSRWRALAALRPDLKYQSGDWLLLARPRAEASWNHFRDPPPPVADTGGTEVFVHEALVRYRAARGVYLSAGRENLQWGPSYLLSVSNPFNPDNGRNNPTIEVPGLDYARVAWLASTRWSLGAIANVSAGKPEHVGAYPQQFALKLDYNGDAKYFSLIPSWREPAPGAGGGRDYRLGAYAGWTVSDALLLYSEGSYGHADAHYALLGGGAYTFAGGTNVALEYYRNGAGCTQEPYAQCRAAGAAPAQPAAQSTPLGLGRRNYVLLQVLDRARFKRWDFTLRWIEGLDDNSGQLIGIAELDAAANTRLYFIAAKFLGGADTESGSVLKTYASLGVRLSF